MRKPFISNKTTPQPVKYGKTADDVAKENDLKIEKMNQVKIGQPFPSGILYSTDSTNFSTDIYQGKLLFLDFWATWCGPCLESTPVFNALGEKYRNEKVEFISVAMDDEFRFWKKFITENKWAGQNLWLGMKEDEPLFSFTYAKIEDVENILIALPQYIVISPDGQIISKRKTISNHSEFEKEIQVLIEKYGS